MVAKVLGFTLLFVCIYSLPMWQSHLVSAKGNLCLYLKISLTAAQWEQPRGKEKKHTKAKRQLRKELETEEFKTGVLLLAKRTLIWWSMQSLLLEILFLLIFCPFPLFAQNNFSGDTWWLQAANFRKAALKVKNWFILYRRWLLYSSTMTYLWILASYIEVRDKSL